MPVWYAAIDEGETLTDNARRLGKGYSAVHKACQRLGIKVKADAKARNKLPDDVVIDGINRLFADIFSARELWEALVDAWGSVSIRSVIRRLNKFVAEGFVRRVGSGRDTRYLMFKRREST